MVSRDLENALWLRHSAPGQWTAHADAQYESLNGMFGGWTTAVALRAVCDEADGDVTPSAVTVNFVNKVEPGRDVVIETRRVGESRSVSYWQSELTVDTLTVAVASVVLTQRRETDGRSDITMPDVPEPVTLESRQLAPGPCGQQVSDRPIVGYSPFHRDSTYSAEWVREKSGRTIDHLQLAFLADHRAPRSFYWSDGPRPSATLTLSVYFHATNDELAAVGDDDVLSEAFGIRGVQSTSEEHLRLWSRHGALLATSIQMAWYR